MLLNTNVRKIFFIIFLIFNNKSYANNKFHHNTKQIQDNNFKNCTKYKYNNLRLACYDKILKYNNSNIKLENPKEEDITSKEIKFYNDPKKVSQIYDINKKELDSLNDLPFLKRLNFINYLKKIELLNHQNKFSSLVNKKQFLDQAYLEAYTPLSYNFDLDKNEYGLFRIRSHNPTYLIPILFNEKPNKFPYTKNKGGGELFKNAKKIESKIQLSFKIKIADNLLKTPTDLWFGYTQTSYWQSYDNKDSAPFRETNYIPEFFITYPFKYYFPKDIVLRMFSVGIIHESNGREDPFSRSWNRIYLMSGLEWKQLTIIPALWWKIYQGKKYKQDNPDINDYKGVGQIKFIYKLPNNELITASIHGNPFNNKKTGIRINYSISMRNSLKFFIQGFYGYGDNLIDYNVKTKSIGFGLLLNDFDGF